MVVTQLLTESLTHVTLQRLRGTEGQKDFQRMRDSYMMKDFQRADDDVCL